MAHLAFRSFTTLGYFAAALLIAIVAALLLTSFGDESSGSQAVDTATPTPTPVPVTRTITTRPAHDGDVRIEPASANRPATQAYSGSDVASRGIGIRSTSAVSSLAGDGTIADETPYRPLTFA